MNVPMIGGQRYDNAPSLSMRQYAARDDWVVLSTTYGEWLGYPADMLRGVRYSDPVTLRGRVRGMGERQIKQGEFLFWHLDAPRVLGRYGDLRFYLMPLHTICKVWKSRPTWDTTPEPEWWHLCD